MVLETAQGSAILLPEEGGTEDFLNVLVLRRHWICCQHQCLCTLFNRQFLGMQRSFLSRCQSLRTGGEEDLRNNLCRDVKSPEMCTKNVTFPFSYPIPWNGISLLIVGQF